MGVSVTKNVLQALLPQRTRDAIITSLLRQCDWYVSKYTLGFITYAAGSSDCTAKVTGEFPAQRVSNVIMYSHPRIIQYTPKSILIYFIFLKHSKIQTAYIFLMIYCLNELNCI